MKQFIYATTLLSSALFLTACGDPSKASEANFEKALSSYYSQKKPICLDVPDGREMPIKSQTENERLDALVDAGLFEKAAGTVSVRLMFPIDGQSEREVDGFIYTPTEEANNYLVKSSNTFLGTGHEVCFGEVSNLQVTNYTAPSQAMGITISRVHHTFEIANIPEWAKSEDFKSTFANIEQKMQKNENNSALVLTSKGWLHERDPKAGLR